jgi:hypothetical protein
MGTKPSITFTARFLVFRRRDVDADFPYFKGCANEAAQNSCFEMRSVPLLSGDRRLSDDLSAGQISGAPQA